MTVRTAQPTNRIEIEISVVEICDTLKTFSIVQYIAAMDGEHRYYTHTNICTYI